MQLAPGPAEIVDQVPSGRIIKDGRLIGDEGSTGISERRKLSFAGIVCCSVVLDRQGRLADEIDLELVGLPGETASGEAMDDVLYDAAADALESIPPAKRKDRDRVTLALERALRSATRSHWGKKPAVCVFVAKV